jgi:hypothetical protein
MTDNEKNAYLHNTIGMEVFHMVIHTAEGLC